MARSVSIMFHLEEEVTPEIFAQRVAQACADQYAIRPGEGAHFFGADHQWVVTSPGVLERQEREVE